MEFNIHTYKFSVNRLVCLKQSCANCRISGLQEGVDVGLADKNGKTPLMLATGRKHFPVVDYIKAELKSKNSFMPKIDFW